MSIYIFISILSYLIVIIISGKKGRIFILNHYNSRLKKVNVVYTVNFIPVNPNITILYHFCNEPYDWIATYDFYYLIVLNDFTYFFLNQEQF